MPPDRSNGAAPVGWHVPKRPRRLIGSLIGRFVRGQADVGKPGRIQTQKLLAPADFIRRAYTRRPTPKEVPVKDSPVGPCAAMAS